MRDLEGVSPVIAVILMVAITVVLTAVLYMMLTGLMFEPGTVPPHGTVTHYNKVNSTADEVYFGQYSPPVKFSEFRVRMEIGQTKENYDWSDAQGTYVNAVGNYTIAVDDFSGDGKISRGDKLIINGLSLDSSYTIKMVHIASGAVVAEFDWDR
jgi:flagellin-like protein